MSRAQLNYSLRRNKTATRGSGATNQLRDAAAEKLKGTEAGLKPHQPMSYATDVAVITGVGPGTGQAIAAKFAEMGWKTCLLARNQERVDKLAKELTDKGLEATGYACDVADENQVESVIGKIRRDYGAPSVLVHNAVRADGAGKNIMEWKLSDLSNNFEVNMLGLNRLIQMLGPDMIKNKSGTIICTGNTSAHRGKAWFGSLASTKAGQRLLMESAARHMGPLGVHVAYVTIDAAIAGTPPANSALKRGATSDYFIQPSAIAHETYHLVEQDRSSWTFDMWIRPFGETW